MGVAGDLVVVITYAQVDDAEARALVPRVVRVDAKNRARGVSRRRK